MTLLLLVLNILSLSVLAIYTIIVICGLFIGVPVIPSHRRIGQTAAHVIKDYQKKMGSNLKAAELGAGYGGQALQLSRHLPDMKWTAFELNYIAWAIFKLRLIYNRRKNLTVARRNFFRANLSSFDVIFCYLSQPMCIKPSDRTDASLEKKQTQKASFVHQLCRATATSQADKGPARPRLFIFQYVVYLLHKSTRYSITLSHL